jgi:hypothetical protein
VLLLGDDGVQSQGEAALGLADLLLGQLSPQERALLDVFGPALVENGGNQATGDGALGFGVTDVAWLSVTVPVATAVVSYMADIAKDAAADAAKERLTAWLTSLRLRRAAPPPSPPPPLPPELASRAGRLAYEHARALGLEEPRARLLGAAVHGSLAGPAATQSS